MSNTEAAVAATETETETVDVAKLARAAHKKWTKARSALPTSASADVVSCVDDVLRALTALNRVSEAEALEAQARALRGQ